MKDSHFFRYLRPPQQTNEGSVPTAKLRTKVSGYFLLVSNRTAHAHICAPAARQARRPLGRNGKCLLSIFCGQSRSSSLTSKRTRSVRRPRPRPEPNPFSAGKFGAQKPQIGKEHKKKEGRKEFFSPPRTFSRLAFVFATQLPILLMFKPGGCHKPNKWSILICRRERPASSIPGSRSLPPSPCSLRSMLSSMDPISSSRAAKKARYQLQYL